MVDTVPDRQPVATRLIQGDPAPLRLSRPLGWYSANLAAIFRPFSFYRNGIHRVSLWSSIYGVLINVGLTAAISTGSLVANDHSLGQWPKLYSVPLIWLGITACTLLALLVASLLLAPAISGVETRVQALRRSFRLMAWTTAVYPLAAVMIMVLAYNQQRIYLLSEVIGYLGYKFVYSVPFVLCVCWPFALMFVGVFCDRRRTEFPRRLEQQQCDLCGYLLVVIPEERVCPECGRPAEFSERPELKSMPPAEREATGRPTWREIMATWVAALVWPASFWHKTRVRCDSRIARQAAVKTMVLATAIGWVVSLALAILILLLPCPRDEWWGYRLFELGEAFLILLPGTLVGAFLLNQFLLLLAVAVSIRRGNALRIDELARIGYYTLGLAACLEIGLTFLFSIAVAFFEYVHPPGWPHQEYIPLAVLLLLGAPLAALPVWSAVSMIRGMEAARYNRF
jgi:hypothetical protein